MLAWLASWCLAAHRDTDARPKRGRSRARLPISPRGKFVDVVLDITPGKMAGLGFSRDPSRNVLVVRQLHPGTVSDWNAAHPSEKIEIGNIIVAVDGITGDASQMRDACVRASKSIREKALRLKIMKP